MAAEGMDIPKLNTIILASPKSDIVQAVGRILREKPNERTHKPLIVDILDTHENFSVFQRQYKKRLSHYQKMDYSITLTKVDGTCNPIVKKKRSKTKKIYESNICLIDDE
jgi:superfamily II DNA or RNA helicase